MAHRQLGVLHGVLKIRLLSCLVTYNTNCTHSRKYKIHVGIWFKKQHCWFEKVLELYSNSSTNIAKNLLGPRNINGKDTHHSRNRFDIYDVPYSKNLP